MADFDERAIRREFRIPESAQLVSYSASPSSSGWFGREGLKIEMVFQLTPDAYDAYERRVNTSGTWKRLPIPLSYLRRLASVETVKRHRTESYASRGEALPPEGSVYNPTERQMLEQFIESLPPQPLRGLFQVRTAGTDVLHAPKLIVSSPDRDLPDFMLVMLDDAKRLIIVKVSTNY